MVLTICLLLGLPEPRKYPLVSEDLILFGAELKILNPGLILPSDLTTICMWPPQNVHGVAFLFVARSWWRK
jgi:hypothetical protein